MAYDKTYAFTTQAIANNGEWQWDSTDFADHSVQTENTAAYWCWTDAGTTSSGTGAEGNETGGYLFVYPETSSPVDFGDSFTATMVDAEEVDAGAYDLLVQFIYCVQGNPTGALYFDAWDGTQWNNIDSFAGDAVNTLVTSFAYDFGIDGLDYTNADFKVRFRVEVEGSGNAYHHDFVLSEVHIYGEDKVSEGTYDQTSFRGYDDDATPTPKASLNTNWNQIQDENFRVRFLIQEDADVEELDVAFQLQYNKNSEGWNNVNAGSSVVRSSASSNITEDANTSQVLGSGTFVTPNGGYDEVDGVTAGTADFSVTINEETEIEYCCQIRSADTSRGDTIQLRIRKAPNVPLDVYTNTPTLTIPEGAGMMLASADRLITAASAENPGTFNFEKSLPWGAITLALRVASGAASAEFKPGTKYVTLETTGEVINTDTTDIDGWTIAGDLTLQAVMDLADVNVSGILTFDAAGTYNISGGAIDTVANTSGGAVIVNLTGGASITTNNGPSITINNNKVHTITGMVENSEVTYVERGSTIDTGSDGSSTTGSRNFVTTNAWTPDAYKGHLLYITSGADAGRYYVTGNSATTLYLDKELTATAGSLDWELYNENDDVVLYHLENVTSSGQSAYSYNYTADKSVDIIVHHVNYEQVVLEDVPLTNSDTSIPVPQIEDANYFNPT